MNPLQLILIAIRGLSVVVDNPLLGGGSTLKRHEISEFLGLLGELVERGDEAVEELKNFAETVQAMADKGREPTREEWATLRARSDDAHAVIQAAVAEEVDLSSKTETELIEMVPEGVVVPSSATKADLIALIEGE